MNEANFQALSEIILPPGSTSTDLQAAVDSAASGDTIIISGDMPFTEAVIILEEKEITIQSDESNNWVMSVPGSNMRHFTVRGHLILQNITLDGGNIGGGAAVISGSLTMNEGAVIQNCRSSFSGGGVNVNGGNLTVNERAVIQNCYTTSNGGGAYVRSSGTITINGGIIQENTAGGAGAGIMSESSSFIMTDGEFIGNTAGASGGAIQMLGSNTITISGGTISGNTAAFQAGGIGIPSSTSASISNVIINGNTARYNGGGLYIQGTVAMSGVTISGNTANGQGGGIYSYGSGRTEITGESYIINNNASNGGGIYTADNTYSNLITGSETVFSCNWASTAYQPPAEAGTLYPAIQFASTSITDHPLNNFDINYSTGEPVDVYSNVTYEANGGIGSYTGPDIITGETDTVLSQTETGISRDGHTFVDWNTEPDGSGISYLPGETITLGCDLVLFAQWALAPIFYNVTYNSNGGTGSHTGPDIIPGETDTVLSQTETGISRDGHTFVDWNTEPDGSGTSYLPGITITLDYSLVLFAQWIVAPKIYTITYDCNGGTGEYIDHCGEFEVNYTILSETQTGISRTGSTFTAWNTQPDGSGISYAPGDIAIISDNITLYAQWMSEQEYIITYNCNGGIGGYIDRRREFEIYYVILSPSQTGISRTGFVFIGWNTQPDGSGIFYAQGEVITVSGDLILYAQWRRIPVQKRLCRKPATKCRTAIEGQKLWIDNDNAGNTRPPIIEIILLRDGEVYKRANVDSAGDGYFGFCCIPVWKNSKHKYSYQIDEAEVAGYTKIIDGYNVINMLNP